MISPRHRRLSFAMASVLMAFLAAAVSAQEVVTLFGRVLTDDGKPMVGIEIRVTGYGGDVTTASGEYQIHLPGLSPGQEVTVYIAGDEGGDWVVLWPQPDNVRVSRNDPTDIVVVEKDSPRLKTTAELRLMFQQSGINEQLSRLTVQDLDTRLAKWADYITRSGLQQEALLKLLDQKRKQIETLETLSTMLDTYTFWAEEVDSVFARHAVQAIGWPEAGRRFNPLLTNYNQEGYNEFRENRHHFITRVGSYWGEDREEQLAKLFDAVETLHKTWIYPLNEVKELINALNYNRIDSEEERETAETRVAELTKRLTTGLSDSLATLKESISSHLSELAEESRAF